MSLNIHALGRRIKVLRRKRGLSQYTLSEIINKSPTYLSYIEGGLKTMSLETFVDIVNALDTTADALLQDSLDNTVIIINSSFSDLLSDCSSYEQRTLLEVSTAVKTILRNRRQ